MMFHPFWVFGIYFGCIGSNQVTKSCSYIIEIHNLSSIEIKTRQNNCKDFHHCVPFLHVPIGSIAMLVVPRKRKLHQFISTIPGFFVESTIKAKRWVFQNTNLYFFFAIMRPMFVHEKTILHDRTTAQVSFTFLTRWGELCWSSIDRN